MRIAITGTTGRVGAALAAYFRRRHEVLELPRSVLDLADAEGMARALGRLECDVFLNPAGLTVLEACEDDPALARRLNAEAPGELAVWAAARGVKLVHFSTDYVFAGREPGLRGEDEVAEPLSVYGQTKREGEVAVLRYPGACVARVSWVFGPEKTSFADGMMRAALAGEPLSAIGDKFSLPTHTRDLAEAIEGLVEMEAEGVVHVCQSGQPVSWHGMAEVVVEELARLGRLAVRPGVTATKLADVPALRAARPIHSAMATERLAGLLGAPLRPWQEALREYVRECVTERP